MAYCCNACMSCAAGLPGSTSTSRKAARPAWGLRFFLLRTPAETISAVPSLSTSVLYDQAGSGESSGLSSDTRYAAPAALWASMPMWDGVRSDANELLNRRGNPARTPRRSRASSSTTPLAAAPSTPMASSTLLLPTPLAPMKQLTRPSSMVSAWMDLNPLMWTWWMVMSS